ncbi:MAG: serine/threonine-protein kinase [Tepidisphaeraceae bacterium]
MTEHDLQRQAFQVFTEVIAIPSGARAARLAEAVGENFGVLRLVNKMLAADGEPTLGEEAVKSFLGEQIREEPTPQTVESHYNILRVIGEGSSGTVYEAEQELPRRLVAIKAMNHGLRSPQLRKRFAREARLLGKLNHPGIAALYEADLREESGSARPYFVMEFVDGKPLDAYLAVSALTVRQKLELFSRLCSPIHYAHGIGVLHRDLKPANILVQADGTPKIVDFGVGCTIGDTAATLAQQAGQLVGTLAYMSPEQIDGNTTVDARTDIYSLGVILYEMLTGELPVNIRGHSLMTALRRLSIEVPRPLSTHLPQLAGLDPILARATAADASERYASADVLCQDIAAYLNALPAD